MSECAFGDGWKHKSGHVRSKETDEPLHRQAYRHFVGPIPEDWIVHHVCENPGCVNPEHLQAMSISDHRMLHSGSTSENFPCGHPRTSENSYPKKTGFECKECHKAYNRANQTERSAKRKIWRQQAREAKKNMWDYLFKDKSS